MGVSEIIWWFSILLSVITFLIYPFFEAANVRQVLKQYTCSENKLPEKESVSAINMKKGLPSLRKISGGK